MRSRAGERSEAEKEETVMSDYNIAVLVGSLRRESYNRQLADALAALFTPHISLRQLEIGDLPLYNQDHDKDQPEPAKRLKREVAAAHGVILLHLSTTALSPGS